MNSDEKILLTHGSGGKLTRDLVRKQPLGLVGGAIVLGMLLVSTFAPLIAPHDPIDVNFANMLLPPGPEYFLGTDQFGQG